MNGGGLVSFIFQVIKEKITIFDQCLVKSHGTLYLLQWKYLHIVIWTLSKCWKKYCFYFEKLQQTVRETQLLKHMCTSIKCTCWCQPLGENFNCDSLLRSLRHRCCLKIMQKSSKSYVNYNNNNNRQIPPSQQSLAEGKSRRWDPRTWVSCRRMTDSCCFSVSCPRSSTAEKPGELYIRVSVREPKAGLPADSRRQSHAAAAAAVVTCQKLEHFYLGFWRRSGELSAFRHWKIHDLQCDFGPTLSASLAFSTANTVTLHHIAYVWHQIICLDSDPRNPTAVTSETNQTSLKI